MYTIDNKTAQDIVNRVMNVIPYNVNIMNQDGIIIASGDKTRVNKLHQGALDVLKQKKYNEIYKDTGKEKAGINSPIMFSDEVVGVIGITGNPDDIRQFIKLVRITAELLVNEHFIYSKQQSLEMQINKFFYGLIQSEGEYSESTKREATQLGINLDISKVAIVISVLDNDLDYYIRIKDKLHMFLEEQEFIIEYFDNTLIILLNVTQKQKVIIDILSEENVKIGIGLKEKTIFKTVKQANLAMKVGNTLSKNQKILNYKDLYFLSTLTTCEGNDILKKHIEILKNEGDKLNLIDTILAYIQFNGEMNSIAKELNIHRNTLNYRLEKIHSITGKNPKNILDLLELYLAYIIFN